MTSASYRELLQRPGVRQVLVAACLSRLAGRMVTLAIILFALDRFQSPALVGWVAFASLGPGLLVSPLAGAMLDRIGAVSAIAVDMIVSAALLFLFVGISLGGAMPPPLMLLLVGLFSLTSPLSAAAIRVLIPGLVSADDLDRANALDAGSYAVIDVVGPAVAGALIGFVGAHFCILIIAALYLLAALALLPLAGTASREQTSDAPPLLREAAAGVLHVLRHRSLRGLAVAYSLYQVSMGVLIVVVPIALSRQLDGRGLAEAATGGLFAVAGLAGGAGALCAGYVRTGNRERDFIGLGALITAVAIFPLATFGGLVGLVCAVVIVGFCAGPVDVGLLSLRQRRTEPGWLGRVLAVSMSLNLSGLPLGSAMAGVLMAYSSPTALAAGAFASLLAALAVYALVPEENSQGR
jgi:predicted MFS family arabinose efflux permease